MEMFRRTFAEINLDHLAHNVSVLQSAFPNTPLLCPMVKANAYGHGDVPVSLFLESKGIRQLGVCLIEEGLRLRKNGVQAEILVFRGFDRAGAKVIADHNLTAVVSSWEQIEHLEATVQKPIGFHLKFDTGMNRLGFRPEEAPLLFDRLWKNKKIHLKAILTHLFQGEDAERVEGMSASQLNQLKDLNKIFEPFGVYSHALNSAGILSLIKLNSKGLNSHHPLLAQNWGMRPGLMLYGYSFLAGQAPCVLKPVMSLKSHVGAYRKLKKGDSVSYGATWRAKQDSVIGVVPIGYADGYHRILSNKGSVLFAGKKVPIVGNICMDYLMIDVTEAVRGQDLANFHDEEVTLFGYSSKGAFLSAEEVSMQAQSITWEVLTSVGERVPRRYVSNSQISGSYLNGVLK